MKIKIGTRESRLAVIQAKSVADKIEKEESSLETELVRIKTAGDKGEEPKGEGVFVKEINRAVGEKKVDLGVHSLKDLPTNLPKSILLACVPERLSPKDVLITEKNESLFDLPSGSIIGTGSTRRKSEISNLRGDLKFEKIRGNIETRIEKMKKGSYRGLITSLAALQRLGLENEVSQKFEFEEVVPAAGQGSLGVVARSDDKPEEILKSINDEKAHSESICERAYLRKLGLGCAAGAGIIARAGKSGIKVTSVLHEGGERRLVKIEGDDPSSTGKKAAGEVKG